MTITANYHEGRTDAAPVIAQLNYSTGEPYFRLSLGGLSGLTIFISPEGLTGLHAEIGLALLAYEHERISADVSAEVAHETQGANA